MLNSIRKVVVGTAASGAAAGRRGFHNSVQSGRAQQHNAVKPSFHNFHRKNYYWNQANTMNMNAKAGSWKAIMGIAAVGVAALMFQNVSAEESAVQEEEKQEQEQTPENAVPPRLQYKYVIIGGGTAAFSALQELLSLDPEAEILIVSADSHVPYVRPALSKELWRTNDPEVSKNLNFTNFEGKTQNIFYEPEAFYKGKVTFLLNHTVSDIDPLKKAILLGTGQIVDFEKCLIATGGTPRTVPGVDPAAAGHVSTFRSLADFQHLENLTKEAKHIVVVGGSFLGSELACSLANRGKSNGVTVTQVFPETGLMANNFPRYLSDYTTSRVKNELGYTILPERLVSSVTKTEDNKVEVVLDNQHKIVADHVVVAAGIRPNNELAHLAELEVDPSNGGIVVNGELQARSDIYVAGDVASYYDPILGRRRVEHYDHAVSSGKHAAENMVGGRKPYVYLPFFWGDLGTIAYEAVGNIDARLRTVSFWEQPQDKEVDTANPDYRRGVVYYVNDKDQVVGVLLWNVWGKVADARNVIRTPKLTFEELQHSISLEQESH